LARAARTVGAFAEDGLAAWCEAAGLAVSQALSEDLAPDGGSQQTVLSLVKSAGPDATTAPSAPTPKDAVKLAVYRSDDDCPYLRYYPAAWPIAVGEAQRVKWLALSQGAGFSGLKVRFGIDDPAAVSIGKISVHAYPFSNGQITSPTALAACVETPPAAPLSLPLELAIEPFEIQSVEAQSRKQIIVLVGLELTSMQERAFTIRPAIAARSPATEPLSLPPLKLLPRRPRFTPASANAASSRHQQAILRLNEAAVLSTVAILNDDGEPIRRSIRECAETWLAGLSAPADTQLSIETQK
jgi:hypothetical protein